MGTISIDRARILESFVMEDIHLERLCVEDVCPGSVLLEDAANSVEIVLCVFKWMVVVWV